MAASSSSMRANGSDVPESSSAGMSIEGQCAIRASAVSGPPGRWSGYERQTRAAYGCARTTAPGTRTPATASEATRPP